MYDSNLFSAGSMQRLLCSGHEPDDRKPRPPAHISVRRTALFRLLHGLSLVVFGAALSAQTTPGQDTSPTSTGPGQYDKDYRPREMQLTDPELKSAGDLATKLSEQGEYERAIHVLEDAHDLSIRKGLRNDRALLEDHLARVKILNGDLSNAKAKLLVAEALASDSGNLVLEADILAGLARLGRINREVKASFDLIDQALALATKSKNLWIQAYCLGEKADLQLSEGQLNDARTNLEEALRIDKLNHYEFEVQHSLEMARLAFAAGEDSAKGIEWANTAKDLAVKAEDFTYFIQSLATLAKALAQSGKFEQCLTMVQQARDGVTGNDGSTFHNLAAYKKYGSFPINQIAFLEDRASCYSISASNQDARQVWMELYSFAVAHHITPAIAEAAHNAADRYRSENDVADAVKWYGIAVGAWGEAGNREHEMDAMASRVYELIKDQRQEEAITEVQKLILLARESKDVRRELMYQMTLVVVSKPTGEVYKNALVSAEALLPESLTIPGVKTNLTVELFRRLAEMYGSEGQQIDQLISLEKELFLAGPKQKTDLTLSLDQEIKAKIESLHLLEKAETDYKEGDLAKALLEFELVQKFDEYDFELNAKDYNKIDDPILIKMLDITNRLGAQKGGPEILEANRRNMGPLAGMIWFQSELVLASYYAGQNQFDKVIDYASLAWPYLHLKAEEHPQQTDVRTACALSLALLQKHEIDDAAQKVSGCLSSAQAFGDPRLLFVAHSINISILTKAGKTELAEGSVEYLRKHPVHDVSALQAIAAGQWQAGDWKGMLASLEDALATSEAGSGNAAQTASLHLQIADLIGTHDVNDESGQGGHIHQAEMLYEKLGDSRGRADALLELAAFSIRQHDWKQAETSLRMAVQLAGKHSAQEARAKSLEGDRLRAMGEPDKALAAYRAAAQLYHELGDKAKEAETLHNLARTQFLDLKKPRDALGVLKQANQLAEQSNQWGQRVDVLRLLASVDRVLGDFPSALDALGDALRVSNREGVPMISASIELQMCDSLADVGQWEEALRSANDALPVMRRSGTKDDQFSAYLALINIYSARDSSIQDFGKALNYAKWVKEDLGVLSGSQSAVLSLYLSEIDFQQGNFNQAALDARTALSYWKTTNDLLSQASAFLSLSEALRASGDVAGSVDALAQARPLTEQSRDFGLSGRLQYVQANLYRREGKLDLATDSYEQVIRILEGVKAGSSGTLQGTISETYDYIYGELIDAYLLRGKDVESYRETAAEKAFEVAELNKARTFTSTWGRSLMDALRQKLPADLQEEERTLDERRSSLESELNQPPSGERRTRQQIGAELEKLATEEKSFQAKLRKSSPRYADLRYPGRMKISDLPLRPGEVLVEFKMFQAGLYVWMIQGTDSVPHILSFYKVDQSRDWFRERVLDLRSAMNRSDLDGFDPQASEELFNALFPGKAADLLRSAGSLIFIPDDVLSLLPFEVLSPEATRDKFVLMEVPTSYFPSGSGFRITRSIKTSDKAWRSNFFAMADPVTSLEDERYKVSLDQGVRSHSPEKNDRTSGAVAETPYGENEVSRDAQFTTRGYFFERLPETAQEVNGIAGLFAGGGTTIRMGMEATKDALLQTDLSQYRFIHFATHGFLPAETAGFEPALILSYQGKEEDQMMLKISEISRLPLHADMVVLSACNTGSGRVTHAEGVLSLGSAFLSAGSSSVVVSMWKVADKTTDQLMQQFYKNLLSGMPKNKALAEARTQLFLSGKTQPFYWAPFVLSGE